MRNALSIFLALSALALSGCLSGSGEGLDEDGRPPDETPPPPPPPPFEATWRAIQDNVFTPICVACHVGAGPPAGLNLEEANSYAMLVGVDSSEQPSIERVAPFDPDNSYIIMKLEGAAGISGGRMPLGGPFLDQATIDVIRQWITDGALP